MIKLTGWWGSINMFFDKGIMNDYAITNFYPHLREGMKG